MTIVTLSFVNVWVYDITLRRFYMLGRNKNIVRLTGFIRSNGKGLINGIGRL